MNPEKTDKFRTVEDAIQRIAKEEKKGSSDLEKAEVSRPDDASDASDDASSDPRG